MMFNSLRCHYCLSEQVKDHSVYDTKNNGTGKLHQCVDCQQVFSGTENTFLERLKKPIIIINVLKYRSEGIGFDAVCRVSGIGKNTLLEWESRFADLKNHLMIYAWMHTLALVQLGGKGLCGHWDHEKFVPSKFLIEDSQGNGGHFFGSEMSSHEVVHNPMDIQCSLKSILIFCVGVGFPPECWVASSQITVVGFAVIGMDCTIVYVLYGFRMIWNGSLIFWTFATSFVLWLRPNHHWHITCGRF